MTPETMTQDLTIRTDHLTARCINIIRTRAITRTQITAVITRTTIPSIAREITTIIIRMEIEVTTGPTCTTLAEALIIKECSSHKPR
jgi:hypothetical protein